MELFWIGILTYFIFFVPFKLWVANGKLNDVEAKYSAHVGQLQASNSHYVEKINSLKKELETSNNKVLFYYNAWSEELDRQSALEELLMEAGIDESIPPLYDQICDILYGSDEEEKDA